MFGFILKKNFCDGWDNLLSLVVTNLIFILAGFGVGVFMMAATDYPLVFALAFLVACIVISILAIAYGQVAAQIANFKGVRVADFFAAIPGSIVHGVLFGLLCGFICLISFVCVNYYFLRNPNLISFLLGAMICWLDLIVILSFQWFIPIRSLMKNDFKKCIKKCFLIFFDNTCFSIVMGFYNLILFILSFGFLGFLPSVAGLVIADTNALRILLYKYDYLEEHPELSTPKERRKIPWEELIYEDRETLGPRKLKSFIFPWRDER